jgi:hypothetical protein
MAARAIGFVRFNREWWQRHAFAVYLAAVGGISATMYVVVRCGVQSPLRYDTLSIFLAIALAAIFFIGEQRRILRIAGIVTIVAWACVSAIGHANLWDEYLPHPPTTSKDLIVKHLDARGIRYAVSDYWIAYHVTFLTKERIIVAADDVVRIKEYGDIVAAHKNEAIRISRRPCGGGPPVIPGVYFCPLE